MLTRRLLGRIAAASLVPFVLTTTPAWAGPRPELDVTAGMRPAPATRALAARTRASAALLAIATPRSIDERYDVPTMLWATRGQGAGQPGAAALRPLKSTIEADARRHLGLVSGFYGLQAVEAAEVPLRSIHDTGHGGIVATFGQAIDGIDVFRDEVKVLMDRDHALLAVTGYIPSRGLVAKAGTPVDPAAPGAPLAADRALAAALSDFAGQATASAARFVEPAEGGYERWDVSAADASWPDELKPGGPVRVKRVLFHEPEALVPAWYVELMAPSQAYMYVVSAVDGSLLFRHDIMASDAFSYRVWAQTTGAHLPHDGPQGTSASPHPTGLPDFFAPGFVAPSLVTLQNGPISTNDPWLAAGATQTLGNNVDAYADLSSPDGFSAGDFRATTTGANTFDRTYDVTQAPGVSTGQRMAAITQLFYDDNFFHDWYYDSGFDEASGNGQANNFGRGGLGSDAMRAEAQDFSGTNNANMSTPPDGSPGRMQMYVFNLSGSGVTVSAPPGVGPFAGGVATGFGPQTFSVSGNVVVGTPSDGCSALTNAAQVAGKVCLIDRGTCSFLIKAQAAQAAGAIACLIADNVSAFNPPGLGGSGSLTIPVLSVTQAAGNAIKAALGSGTVTVSLVRQASLSRDGTIDNAVVAHEWGHFISNRLVGDAAGLSTNMSGGLGEGWGDFHAMLLTVRPEDSGVGAAGIWSGVYALAGYALFPSVGVSNAYYFGIRRVPYSTDMTRNGLTFKHIQNGNPLPAAPPTSFGTDGSNNAEVHNTGEVWCTMLWECYAALLRDNIRLTFADAQQRMRDYLVLAYKLTPNAPTLLEARDALLLAAWSNDAADFHLFWQAFAKRGAGAGAIAPGRFDPNNATVVESFVTGGELALVGTGLNVSVHNCDHDAYLDNGEVGRLTVTLKNVGSESLTATTATLSSTNPHVSFPAGNTVSFANTSPFQTAAVSVPVELEGAVGPEVVDIAASYNDPGLAVAGPVVAHDYSWGNSDEIPSSTESVEAQSLPWTMAGSPAGDGMWTTIQSAPGDRRFLGPDVGEAADHTLTSPPLQVAPTGNFTFTFQHNFDFEKDPSFFYDGGVVEISNDGGANWSDIGTSLSPGYTSTLYNQSGNPLGGRAAYCGQSAGYPGLVPVTASLGTAYQGQTVRVRFRLGCDAGVGAQGWQISTLTFNNILNQPFLAIGTNASDCTPVSVGPPTPHDLSFAVTGGNPAPGSTRFRIGLPSAGGVELAIYDVSGRRVATLAHGELAAGWYDREWAVNDDGRAPASGVYFARLLAGGRLLSSRVVRIH